MEANDTSVPVGVQFGRYTCLDCENTFRDEIPPIWTGSMYWPVCRRCGCQRPRLLEPIHDERELDELNAKCDAWEYDGVLLDYDAG